MAIHRIADVFQFRPKSWIDLTFQQTDIPVLASLEPTYNEQKIKDCKLLKDFL